MAQSADSTDVACEWVIQALKSRGWTDVSLHRERQEAFDAARSLSKRKPGMAVRIVRLQHHYVRGARRD